MFLGLGAEGEGAQRGVQERDSGGPALGVEDLLQRGGVGVDGDGLARAAAALLKDPLDRERPGEGGGQERPDPGGERDLVH